MYNKPKMFNITITVLIASMLLISGCINQGQSKENKEEIKDMAGRKVKIPSKVNKVIGVGPSALRLIIYLNATDKVVGVEQTEKKWGKLNPYNMAHPELQEKPSIGTDFGGDASLITEQDPDVIIATALTEGKANDLQDKTGIPVVVTSPGRTINRQEKFYEALETVGKVLNKQRRTEELIGYTESIISDLNNRTKDIPKEEKPGVYIGGRSHEGGAGIISTQDPFPPFKFLNAKNVASPIDGHAMISREKLVTWNPEIMFISESNLERCKEELKEPKYQGLSVMKNEEIYGILPSKFYGTNFEIVLANSYYIGKKIFPEKFEDIESEEKANEIFEEFVGKPVYDGVRNNFGGFKQVEIN